MTGRGELSMRPPREIASAIEDAVFRAETIQHHPDLRSNWPLRGVLVEQVLAELADLAAALPRALQRDSDARGYFAREQNTSIRELEARLAKARELWRQHGGQWAEVQVAPELSERTTERLQEKARLVARSNLDSGLGGELVESLAREMGLDPRRVLR